MSARPRRRRWLALAAASLTLLVAGGLVIWIGTGTLSGGGSPGALRSSPPTTANPGLIDRQPPVGPESPLLPTPVAASRPTLIVPAIGLRAGIVPEGIDQTPGDVGNLSAPESASEVGWWDGGPAPGQGGVAVITGHRVNDWAFWQLPLVQAGDSVQVIGTNGKTTNWTVTSVQQILKSQLPTSVWTKGGPAKLALVTCGGAFNYAIGHYDDNVLVWAKPAAT